MLWAGNYDYERTNVLTLICREPDCPLHVHMLQLLCWGAHVALIIWPGLIIDDGVYINAHDASAPPYV